ncbi:unnamed protein product [Tuber melanosporum]|uniref:(Perigord truffle) hypothetical protein n=1 Tax=Tuber melanosporum (strain Mel28) TaxID=656061 RepID=D5GCX6_TUBMM|nr:uncharacterized protein GSTUM_00000854001 [Tuber melanosporum]CAZ82369.1 unnamed protein product [Tuber melanosporum]
MHSKTYRHPLSYHLQTDPLPILSLMLRNLSSSHQGYSNLDRVFCSPPHGHHPQRNSAVENSREK